MKKDLSKRFEDIINKKQFSRFSQEVQVTYCGYYTFLDEDGDDLDETDVICDMIEPLTYIVELEDKVKELEDKLKEEQCKQK